MGAEGRPRRTRVAAGLVVAVLASTIGVLAAPGVGQAAPAAPAQADPQPPSAGPGIGASASGEVTDDAPLPGEATTNDELIPGTVRVAPDRSGFRTIEPLSTPLDPSKAAGVHGPTPTMEVGVVRVGDLNGDGIDDLVNGVTLAYGPSRAYLSAMLGLGDGRYTEPQFSLVSDLPASAPYDVQLADVDGDDVLDAIVTTTNSTTGLISLVLGIGDGRFGAPVSSQVVANPGHLLPGSWGGTADVQVVVTGAGGTLHVLDVRAEGFDAVTPSAGVAWRNSNWPVNDLAAADVDEDGASEVYLAMSNSSTSNDEGIQRLTDLTSDAPDISWVAGPKIGVERMAIADVDGDDHLDLVTVERRFVSFTNQYWLQPYRLPGAAPDAPAFPATQTNGTDVGCAGRPGAPALQPADIDGDGDLDLLSVNCQQEINWARSSINDGAGRFEHRYFIATPGERAADPVAGLNRRPMGSAIIDADGDDLPDLVWAGGSNGPANGNTIVLTDPDHPGDLLAPRFVDAGRPVPRDGSWSAQQVRIADWDEDGTPDLVFMADDAFVYRPGDGTGRYGDPVVIESRNGSTWCPTGPGEVRVDDLDADGHLDLVCHTLGKTGMAWGAGPGEALTPDFLNDVPITLNWTGYHGIDAPDLDGDGLDDLVMPVFSGDFDEGSYLYVWFQQPDRTWPDTPAVGKLGSATTVAVADVDDDPEPELVALIDRRKDETGTSKLFDRFVSWSADGAGGLTEHVSDAVASRVADGLSSVPDVANGIGDLDGDGNPDLVTIWWYGNPLNQQRLLVWKGLGDGEFATTPLVYPTSMNWRGNGFQRTGSSIGVADLDGDGNQDVVYESASFGVEILPGNGDGTLAADRVTRWPSGNNNGTIEIGDVDGDDRPDIVSGTDSYVSETLSHVLLLNRSIPNAEAPPDLAVTDVSAPTTIGAGDEVSVDVTITNLGGDLKASQRWKDAAYLSTTPTFSLDATEIDVVERSGPLSAGNSYTVTLTGPARAFQGGAHHLILRTDVTQAVSEPDEANNTATRAIEVTVPTLTPGGDPVSVDVASGSSRLVRIPAVAGRTVTVTATPAAADAVRGRLGADRAPKLGGGTALRPTGTGPLVGSLARGTDGDLYAIVEGLAAAGAGTTVQLVADDAPVGLFSATPGRVANGGDVTLTVTGAGLDGAAMQLRPRAGASGGAVDATRVRAGATPGTWFATFPLADQLGSFDLAASGPAGDALLPSAVVVEAPTTTPNAAEFEVSVSLPGQIRRHVAGPGGEYRPGYAGRVTLRNRTGNDLPAPYLRLTTEGLETVWPDFGAGQRAVPPTVTPDDVDGTSSTALLATVPGGPVDTIPARATITIEFRFFATLAGSYEASVGVWAASDQSGELDWSAEADGLATAYELPSGGAAAIEAALEQVTSHPTRPTYPGASDTGPWPTPGGYVRALDRVAGQLDANGRPALALEELRSHVIDSALATAQLGAPISGTLVEDGGDPGEPLAVTALPVDGTGPVLLGHATADGRFNLLLGSGSEPLTAEPYRLIVDRRLVTAPAAVAVDPEAPSAGVEVTVDRGLPAVGRITAAAGGAPIGGATVALSPTTSTGGTPISTTTKVDGTYRTDGLVAGSYLLTVRADGYASVAAEPIVVGGDGLEANRALVPGATLAGTVTGPGAAGAVLTVLDGSGAPLGGATVAADGTYRVEGLPVGDLEVRAIGDGGASAGATVTTVAPATSLDLTLAAGVAVTGTVVDGAGEPVADATVVASSVATETVLAAVTSGADGTFSIPGVPLGAVSLLVGSSAGGAGPIELDAATEGTGVQLVVGDVRAIRGTVVDGAGDPVAGAAVEASLDGGSPLGDLGALGGGSATSADDGSFELEVGAPGTYVVSTVGAAETVAVADGELDASVELTTTAIGVSGRVLDTSGAPAPEAAVALVVGGEVASSAITDADGRYRFAAIGGGDVEVWAFGPGVGIDHEPLTLPATGSVAVDDLGDEPLQLPIDATLPPGAAGATALVAPAAAPELTVALPVALDVDGAAVVQGLEPGEYAVTVSGPGVATTEATVTVPVDDPLLIPVPVGVGLTSTITDATTGDPVAFAVVSAVAQDGSGRSGSAATAEDGTFTIDGLAPGAYDLWVVAPGGQTLLVGAVTLEAPALAGATPDGAVPPEATTSAPTPIPESFPYSDAFSFTAFNGKVVGPGGTGIGTTPPTVTAKVRNHEVPVSVAPDGSFRIDGAPDGQVIVSVSRDGFETKRYVVEFPRDAGASKTFEMGYPLDAAEKLKPEVVPPLPSAWETFKALFESADPEYHTIDPLMAEILLARATTNPCPGSQELLARAKQAARLAIAQNENYNELVQRLYWEQIRNRELFVTEVLDFGASVVALAVQVGRLGKGIYNAAKAITPVASELTGWKGLLDQLFGLPFAGLAGDVAGLITSGLLNNGKVDFDAALFVQKGVLDGLTVTLNLMVAAVLDDPALAKLADRLVAPFTAALGVIFGLKDVFDKFAATNQDLQDGYALLRAEETGYREAEAQVNKLEVRARKLYALWLAQKNGRTDCDQPKDEPGYPGGVGGAVDPNEIVGPAGVGDDRWLAVPAGLGYEVHFENLGPGTVNPPPGVPLATAPAAFVEVTETIPTTFDRSSFAFDDVGWGQLVVDVPDGVQAFESDVPIQVEVDGEAVDLVVRVAGDYDPGTGAVRWTFTTLDPETGEIPLDPREGFLPPEPGDETGQGWATYSVSGAAGIAQGTYLDAEASIVFDANDPIATNTWRNRVGTPSSTGPVCPDGDTDAGRFVCAVYPDVLGRTPDAAGKAFWVGRLDRGTTRTSAAAQLLSSTEARRLAVRQIFDDYLGRQPDPSGLAFWVGRLQDGATRDDVRRSVLASSEYLRRNGGDLDGFVDGLYDDVYGRSADARGLDHWVGALEAGRSRSSVAAAFLFAAEGRRAIVRQVYADYLDRSLSFDEAQWWARRLATQRDEKRFRSEVLGSDEYLAGA